MAKVYDATLNDLIGARPGDWAAYFARLAGIPPGAAEALDTDLATTVQADRVFRIGGASPALLHLELEANPRLGIPRDLLRYNTLIDHQFALPVETVLILLRPKAEASDQTGVYQRRGPGGGMIAEFRYRVERVWQRSAADWLAAGLGLAPLALLTDEASAAPEPVLDQVKDQMFGNTSDPALRRSIISSCYFLCGLRHDPRRVAAMFERLSMTLEDSTTYQATIEKGELRSLRATIARQGTKKFGTPPADAHSAAIAGIADVGRLERIVDAVLDAASWDELLQTP